jgi:hypothetical protein
VDRFVGKPSMSALARRLGRDMGVRVSHRVDEIERRGTSYALAGTVGAPGVTLGAREAPSGVPLVAFGTFDSLVVFLPPEQTSSLVRNASPTLADSAARVDFEPCLAFAFAPDDHVLRDLPFDGLFVGRDGDPDRVIAWLARDSSKPGRAARESWVLHAAPGWSRAHLRDGRDDIERALLGEMARVVGVPRVGAKATSLRRWAFARPTSPLQVEALFDDDAKIGVGGDWSAGGRVEGAFLSGIALAGRVLGLPEEPAP